MKKIVSVCLLASILLLPVSLVIGFSYLGKAHPLEQKTIGNASFIAGPDKDIQIVFFGFVGCASVCPQSLSKLDSVLNFFSKDYPEESVEAVFVDIRKNVEQKAPEKFPQLFSNKIQGTHLQANERKQVINDFGLRINQGGPQSPLVHTDHFFILKREQSNWKIHRVLSNSTSAKKIKEILQKAAS